jgi:hypothetical protein
MKDKSNFMHPTGYKELTKTIYQEPLQDTDYKIFKIIKKSKKKKTLSHNKLHSKNPQYTTNFQEFLSQQTWPLLASSTLGVCPKLQTSPPVLTTPPIRITTTKT